MRLSAGGAKGIDTDAKRYAHTHNLTLTEFYPDYRRYGKGAPLKRNLEIVLYADIVLAFWDGTSKGTRFVIQACCKHGTPIQIWLAENDGTLCPIDKVMALEK